MITLELKPCCYRCDCSEIYVDNIEKEFPEYHIGEFTFLDYKVTDIIIYCNHARVCKKLY